MKKILVRQIKFRIMKVLVRDFDGMDWKSLRLVFQEKDNIWYLVGIIHDGWTI